MTWQPNNRNPKDWMNVEVSVNCKALELPGLIFFRCCCYPGLCLGHVLTEVRQRHVGPYLFVLGF